MFFNSIDFAVFLPIVFVLYWFVVDKRHEWQNLLIAGASYVFYGWWDWRFLSLILLSTVVDFGIGLALGKEEDKSRRKLLLWISLLVNLGFLFFFKYSNFFIDNFVAAFSFFGAEIPRTSLNIILPVGISFYTFQTLSYTIDVYRKKLEPSNDFVAFAAFVSFFPQLVAGPIERATNLLPQFFKPRSLNYEQAADGLRQILWGLFKKIVIADQCAEYANLIFNNYDDFSGSTLVLGALFFTFQIYCDFSGYSDIAIGTAKLFGFRLMQNFAFPYFSRDIAEFWRRWHISLSTWFRDYLYIPLGGSRSGTAMRVRNTFIIFIVSGFWHGANWTFIVWGTLNAIYFLPLLLTNRNRRNLDTVAQGGYLPSLRELFAMGLTFGLTVLAWVFFRAENIGHAMAYLGEIFSSTLFTMPDIRPTNLILTVVAFVLVEWLQREKKHVLEWADWKVGTPVKWILMIVLVEAILLASLQSDSQEFIYFNF